jgi:predicted phage-related endonuclease
MTWRKRIVASIPIQNEAEWHSVRERFIGGSEVAALFYRWQLPDGSEVIRHMYDAPPGAMVIECLSPYTTGMALYNAKAGIVMPEDFASERIDAGTFLEPALASWATKKWAMKLRKVRRYTAHDEIDGWGASLDYEVHGDGESGTPVEFKNVDWLIFQREWVGEGEEIITPPIHINIQLQHQIGAVEAEHGWIVACVGGNELKRGRIERHEPTQQKIGEAIEAFWANVRAGIPPVAVADYKAVAKAYAEGDKALVADLTHMDALPVLISRYLRWKQHFERLETHLETMKGQIALSMGEACKGNAVGFRLSWPVINREEKEIPARIQKALTYRGALNITREKA